MSSHAAIIILFAVFLKLLLSATEFPAFARSTEQRENANSDSTAVPDSFDKELEAAKKQLQESPEASDVKSVLPESGRVMTSTQKSSSAQDAAKIYQLSANDRLKIPRTHPDGTPTIALAFGGGGVRGAAHVGVLKILEREGIKVDYIIGNSAGAIVGGLYSAGLPLDKITEHLTDFSMREAYMPGGLKKKLATLPLNKIVHPFNKNIYPGLWSGERFTRYLDNLLPQPKMEVEDTKIPFSSVATNLLDGKAYRINKGRLSTAIKASAAIAPIIRPVAIGDKLFIDGGVRANLPASAAKDTGAGIVIAVLVDEPMQNYPPKRFTHLKNIEARISDIVLAIADERQLQYADLVINPNVSMIPVLSGSIEDVHKAIKSGELACEKALPELKKRIANFK